MVKYLQINQCVHDINKRKHKNQPPIKINKFIFKKSHDLVNKQNSTSIQVKIKKTLIKMSIEGIYFKTNTIM